MNTPPILAQRTISAQDVGALWLDVDAVQGRLRFRPCGSSMRPFIQEGDVLTVEPIAHGEASRGDVVLFRRREGQLVAHRVVGRGPSAALLVRGDAEDGEPEPVGADQVLGRISEIRRGT